ncbi:thiosulfate/3-mercaptopyruvate sulfurtransferase [Kaistia soli DSM 19436]|uniref:Thiosulfate/3-mercaptopyruvate sulfurtransferase n=1 Tax=Kaistia soli DSM 19436 TaxID=1122133 RepID=A0A1M5KNB0_9HYPH|nr:sulfurtransferase [Kaistia soli]SHG53989.1 thiosulfate/3-mercaptopyruvate sulfurtransferase [Kaistia soli DSM 19436]
MSDWLVTTDWLASHLGDDKLAVLDCSWYLPDSGKQAIDDFRRSHIPTARFIDLSAVSDPTSPYVNMLPSAELWATEIGRLGIDNETTVIIYDGGYVSARLWWMFRVFGHDNVRILDGGLRKWVAEGRPVEAGDAGQPTPAVFEAALLPGRVADIEDVRSALGSGVIVVDARTAARFDGTEGSGYPGVASGHMPNAINTPWAKFFDPANNFAFVDTEAAAKVFADAGVDVRGRVITTCGSGVTAAILGFMIERAGNGNWTLYDGSWHEWGQRDDTPKLTAAKPDA